MGRLVETNGIRLNCVDHGGDGPVLVLAPGLTANARAFEGLVAHGLTEPFRVLALDLRGRGRSDAPETGYEMADHAADVLGVLDALGIDRCVMGGHSFGGMLSYWIAAHHPDRVERCVAIDAPAEVDPTVLDQIKPALDRLGTVVPSWDAYLSAMKGLPYYDGWWDPMIEVYFRADVEGVPGGVRARSRPSAIQAAVEGTLHVDWPAVAEAVSQPTLLLRATQPFGPPGSPPLLSRDRAERTRDHLGDATLVDVDANHMTMLFGDAAAHVVREIIAFAVGTED